MSGKRLAPRTNASAYLAADLFDCQVVADEQVAPKVQPKAPPQMELATVVAEVLAQLKPAERPSKPFGDLARRWEAQYLPRISVSGRQDVQTSVARLIAGFEDATPAELTRKAASDWLGGLKHFRTEKQLSSRTINKIRGVGRQILASGIQDGDWFGPNAFEQVSLRKLARGGGRVMAPEEAKRFLGVLRPEYRALFAAALYTGARKSELIWWRREDVDLERATAWFRRSHGNPYTKNGSHREIPIHRELLPYLKAQLGSHASDWVFPNEAGERYSDDWNLASVTRRAIAKAGIMDGGLPRDIDFHGLRRVYATLLKRARCDNLTRKLVLGHAVKDVTDEIYTTVDEEFMRAEIEKMSLEGGASAKVTSDECARRDSNPRHSDSKSDGHRSHGIEGVPPDLLRSFWEQGFARITSLLKQGVSVTDISATFGISQKTVVLLAGLSAGGGR